MESRKVLPRGFFRPFMAVMMTLCEKSWASQTGGIQHLMLNAPFQKEDHGRSDRYDDGLAAFRV
jgi:hypothetical protein